jgi:polyisoprenoid-binding protein YceI
MVAAAIILLTALLEDSMTSGTRDFEGIQIPTPGVFTIDPNHTRVSFIARHLMVSKVRGGFTGTKGAITIAENPLESTVEIEIDAATIDTGVTDRDNHLRSPDFLDVEKWPTLTFRSTEVLPPKENEFRLLGELTIRDVSRPVELGPHRESLRPRGDRLQRHHRDQPRGIRHHLEPGDRGRRCGHRTAHQDRNRGRRCA